MNLLKSVFISAFVTWLAIVSVYAIAQLSRGMDPLLGWLGLSLAASAPLAFFIKAFLFRTARTPRHPLEYTALSGLGLAATLAISHRYGQAAGIIHIWAGVTFIGWIAYIRWYSVLGERDASALKVGSPLPDFRLESLDGHVVSSESFKAKPHLLLFYRGNWCPFCTAQVKELSAAYRRLSTLGVEVVLISPQSAQKSQQLAKKFDVPMIFLRDRDNSAATSLGILHDWGTPMGLQALGYDSDTVMPTVVLTDERGNIIYSDQTDNYRVRPEPESFEKLLTEHMSANELDRL
jgi:peroxiredoxin